MSVLTLKVDRKRGNGNGRRKGKDGLEKETENTAEENIACTISEVPWCNG